MKTRLEWGSSSDTGRVRQQNEDSVLAQAPVFIVADGMGGHAAGDVASNLVVVAFQEFANAGQLPTSLDVDAAINSANDAVVDAAANAPSRAGMGSTLVGLVLMNNGGSESWLGLHIGDSRLYRYSDGTLVQLTKDHSVVQELLDDGAVSPEEAAHHPSRHEVTRALGSSPAPQADFWIGEPILGDRFLLCSDGLNSEVPDVDLANALGQFASAEEAADRLVTLALDAGGRDNVSAIVVDVVKGCSSVQEEKSTADGSTRPRIDESTKPRRSVPGTP